MDSKYAWTELDLSFMDQLRILCGYRLVVHSEGGVKLLGLLRPHWMRLLPNGTNFMPSTSHIS